MVPYIKKEKVIIIKWHSLCPPLRWAIGRHPICILNQRPEQIKLWPEHFLIRISCQVLSLIAATSHIPRMRFRKCTDLPRLPKVANFISKSANLGRKKTWWPTTSTSRSSPALRITNLKSSSLSRRRPSIHRTKDPAQRRMSPRRSREARERQMMRWNYWFNGTTSTMASGTMTSSVSLYR